MPPDRARSTAIRLGEWCSFLAVLLVSIGLSIRSLSSELLEMTKNQFNVSLQDWSSTQLVAHEQYYLKNVTHRNTWMPRLCIPMKDVASNDMLR